MTPKPPPKEGPITKALHEAVALRKGLIADGTPVDQANYIVGQGLKATLGNPREEPWHFLCPRCRDTGWSEVRPSPEEEARLMRLYGNTVDHQGYVVKCDPCRYMDREREKRRKQLGQEGAPDDDFSAAGQMKPTRGFKRFGK